MNVRASCHPFCPLQAAESDTQLLLSAWRNCCARSGRVYISHRTAVRQLSVVTWIFATWDISETHANYTGLVFDTPAHASMGKKKAKPPAGDAAAPAAAAAKPKGLNKPVDPRFAAVQTDPRFQRFPAPRKPVTIDERFAGDVLPLAGHGAPLASAASLPNGHGDSRMLNVVVPLHRNVQGPGFSVRPGC